MHEEGAKSLSAYDLKKGQLVVSKMGRDKGKLFVVVFVVDEKFALIADGKHHSVKQPKKKSIRHLIVLNEVIMPLKEKLDANLALTDDQLITALRGYSPRE